MTALLETLESFNRKERFILLEAAIGSTDMRLGAGFREQLRQACGVDVPRDALFAMDYHLDWLVASLMSLRVDTRDPQPNHDRLVQGNQEDIDLLVAFADGSRTQLLLLEAKAATSWSNAQLQSKADRLGAILGVDGREYSEVVPHFVLLSPRPPAGVHTNCWPKWMAPGGDPIWIELAMPLNRRRVTRTDRRGRRSASGGYYRVIS